MQSKVTQLTKNHENVKRQPTNINPKIDHHINQRENYQKEFEAATITIPPRGKGKSYEISGKIDVLRRDMNVT